MFNKIFIEQNPEIRKTGQCTENTFCRIIGNMHKYEFPWENCAIFSLSTVLPSYQKHATYKSK